MEDVILNKVASSALITLDLEDYYHPAPRVVIDLKDFLYEGAILKEKSFREKVASFDWTMFDGKLVAVICSEDVIIPLWAYMIIINRLIGHAIYAHIGDLTSLNEHMYKERLAQMDWNSYLNKKIVIKGCGTGKVPLYAYGEIVARLSLVVDSLMFGEPCSTVPIFKKKRPS